MSRGRTLRPPWKAGESGNPAGRPKGSRNKLGEAFVADLYADWKEHGASVIKRVRAEEPSTYLRVVASILPNELNIKDETLAGMSDEDVFGALRTHVLLPPMAITA